MIARRRANRIALSLASLLVACAASAVAFAGEGPGAPDDPWFPKQARLFETMEVLGAWKITKGSPEVLVGVIDSGFDFYHPDLKGRLRPGRYATGGYHPDVFENIAHGTLATGAYPTAVT